MKKRKLDIIYEDKYLIIINKLPSMLVFIVHRLDKDTSGLVIFAKSEKVKHLLQDNWENVKREYYAIVKGQLKENKKILQSYLKETKTHLVYSTKKSNGKLAITEYEVLKTNKLYSLLKINIKTGRKNQIRVQLNDIGNPIIGDKKYGCIKAKRLYLHAYYLEFIHPVTKELLSIKTNYPKEFNDLIQFENT